MHVNVDAVSSSAKETATLPLSIGRFGLAERVLVAAGSALGKLERLFGNDPRQVSSGLWACCGGDSPADMENRFAAPKQPEKVHVVLKQTGLMSPHGKISPKVCCPMRHPWKKMTSTNPSMFDKHFASKCTDTSFVLTRVGPITVWGRKSDVTFRREVNWLRALSHV